MRPIKFVIFWISATILITGFRLIYVQLQFEAEELAFLYENVVNKSQESYLGIPESVLLHRKSCHDCYKITCSELLFNPSDNDARRTAHYFMTKYNPTILNENDIISLTQNCDVFKKSRNFVLEPLSIEESDFPLAFTILVHRDVAQVERLLRALYAPQNVYCIHIDAKADASIHAALKSLVKCFNNVFIASKIERVVYAGISRLLADINCMKDHLKSSVKWRYLINTAGQAFPLKTNLEMVQILKVYNGSNDIEGLYGRKYLEFRYVNEWKETYLDTDHPKLEKTGQKHQPLPHNLGFVKGSSYGIFSRKFVEYIIDNPVAKDLLVWSSSTWSPDEHYWAILHHTYSNPHIKPPGSYSGGYICLIICH